MNRPMRFGRSALTIALLAAVAIVPCVAQDNHSAPETATAAGDHKAVAGDAHSQLTRSEHVRPFNVHSPRNVLMRRTPVIRAPTPAIRNTIGVAIHPGVTGITTPGGVAPPKFGQPPGSASVKPVTINTGALNGTGLAHHALAPAAIGGPAPAVGGISGSSFRPKHTARP
jgi:hypothetical protein